MTEKLSCPVSPQLVKNLGKQTFEAPDLAKAVSANIAAVEMTKLGVQNKPFIKVGERFASDKRKQL